LPSGTKGRWKAEGSPMHIPVALSFVITDRVPGALEERRIAAVRGAQIRDVRLTGADMGHEPANTDVKVQV